MSPSFPPRPHELAELAGQSAIWIGSHRTGLLEALLSGPGTPAELASRLGLDKDATTLVLEALAALGLAEIRTEDRYGASPALTILDGSIPGGIQWMGNLWSQLPRFLRDGTRFASMDGPPAEREEAYRDVVGHLANLFAEDARWLATRLAGDEEKILDVGAGSGVWSLAMLEQAPRSRLTALDFPAVLPNVLERAANLGLADRVDTIAGDYRTVELPVGTYHRVVAANVLHLESPAVAAALLRRLASALRADGALVVIDGVADGTLERDRARTLYSLHLALRATNGRNHTRRQIESWCRQAGLSSIEVFPMEVSLVSHAALVCRR